jgi:hypothetical protein
MTLLQRISLVIQSIGADVKNLLQRVTILENTITRKVLLANTTNATTTMQPINGLSMTITSIGWYRLEFCPLYDVSNPAVGTGWNLQGGTAVLADYSYRAIFPRTSSQNYQNNYSLRNQNYTVPETSITTNNRGTIIADFRVTTVGTIIPFFRSENTGLVTVKTGSFIRLEKLD